jgi:hypothetical protein
MDGLEFSDLITEKDGVGRVVSTKKGECIPVRSINPEMLSRSLVDGCLSRSIKAGWVIEVEDGVNAPIVEPVKVVKPVEVADPVKVTESIKATVPEQIPDIYVGEQPREIIISDGSKVMDNNNEQAKPEIVVAGNSKEKVYKKKNKK